MRKVILVLLAILFPTASLAAPKKLKVFILCGQSNMQGHAEVRTFEHLGMDPQTVPLLKEMQDEKGKPRIVDDVWISSIGSSKEVKFGTLTAGYGAEGRRPKIGPEFTYGITMHKLLGEPILLIKTAWGGKSLHTDFRPPSAGPFVFRQEQLDQWKAQGKDLDEIKAAKVKATGHYYRLMLSHVRGVLSDIKAVYPSYDQQGYELAGFVWFQGWNDMVDRGIYPRRDQKGGYDDYSEVLTHFIRDVRKDLKTPTLPFVVGVFGVGGSVSKYTPDQKRYGTIHQNFRDAMTAPTKLPEFETNVAAVLTEKFWDHELTQLRYRNNKVNQAVKQKQKAEKLDGKAVTEFRNQLLADEFTKRELRIMEVGISNAEFHYLGSAKIVGRIGQAFARQSFELMRNHDGR